MDNATGFPYTYPLNGAIHQINRYTVDKYSGNQLHLLLSVVYALKDNRKTSKCCHRLHRREWIFSGKTNLDLSLAYHDFQWSLNCQYLAIIRKFDGLDMAYRWYTEKTNVLRVFLFRRVWVRGLGKVCLWLFLLRSTAKNTVTLTNVCVTGYMVHRDQLQRCILCS